MSDSFSGSTGASLAKQPGPGIPKTCACGSNVIAKTSKSEANTYRRYYRCAYAATMKLSGDNHLFRWVEDAIVSEVTTLSNTVNRLECEVKEMTAYMESQEQYAREKAETEVAGKVEEAVVAAKRMMLVPIIGFGVAVCVINAWVMKWLG